MATQKALLIKLGSMGDILQASCMINAIHDHMDVELDVLTYAPYKALFEFHPNVTHVTCIAGSMLGKLHAFLRLFFRRYQVVFIAHRSQWVDFMCWCARIPHRCGFSSTEKSTRFLTSRAHFDLTQSRHVRYLSLVSAHVGASFQHMSYRLMFYPDPTVELSLNVTAPYIVIAPFGGENPWSSMPTRVWGKYAELIDQLLMAYPNHHVVLVGGPEDQMKLASLKNNHQRVHGFVESVHQLALLLREAVLFIGNDSFPLAMAITQRCPSLGLFGPTNATLIVGGYENVTWIQSTVSCSPCYNPLDGNHGIAYHCPYRARCMVDISISDVMNEVQCIL